MIDIKSDDIEIINKGDRFEYHHKPSDMHFEYKKDEPPSPHPMMTFRAEIMRLWWPTNRIDKARLMANRAYTSAAATIGTLHVGETWEEHLTNLSKEKDEISQALAALEHYRDQTRYWQGLYAQAAERIHESRRTLEATQAKVSALREQVRKGPWYKRPYYFLLYQMCCRAGLADLRSGDMVPVSSGVAQ